MRTYYVLIFALLTSCASVGLKDFNEIKVGMFKTDVLDEIGSPLRSERIKNVDFWTYRYYTDQSEVLKEIQLENNFVIYTGDPTPRAKKKRVEKSKQKKLEDALKREKRKQKKNFQDI